MILPRSIKWRMQLWHGFILVLVLAGFGYTAFELQWTREFRRVDVELQEQMRVLVFSIRPFGPGPGRPPDLLRPGGPRRFHERIELDPEHRFDVRPPDGNGEPPGEPPRPGPRRERRFPAADEFAPYYYGIWDREDRLVHAGNLPPGIVPPHRGSSSGIREYGPWREIVQFAPRGEEVMVVGRSVAAELKEMRRLALILLSVGSAILALGLTGGWVVASRAMRPLSHISDAAVKIASGDLRQRIVQDETESELGRIIGVLNSTFARLEAAFAEQARFTVDVSHELRTPVAVIVSQTQTALARERSASEYRETVEACQRAAQRMRRMIESLLQLARLDAGQESLQSRGFDLASVARESLELLQPLAQERNLHFNQDLHPAACTGDPEKISQVISNLVTNAIHYTTAGGEISVKVSMADGLATLTVSDTGVGIPPEDLPHLFNRFYRVEKSRSRDKGGTGLGLAISRAIVHAHGGTIEAASEPNHGASFTVRLPCGG